MSPINPAWDNRLLDHPEKGELAEFDTGSVEGMAREGGGSAHEVRAWIAAFASLAVASESGAYGMTSRFYVSRTAVRAALNPARSRPSARPR
ncbi:hypothetical protein [Streptomyces shaanxiensis]|uniref:Uncharacterized protein n=1 Tax=Streptomyces shaanxiensis TaxID=653357 RepID=A0ABP7V969_9ACTN